MNRLSINSMNNAGFTVIELMVALVVVSIILSVAVPSLSNMIKNNRLITMTNRIVADIHFCRSEAVKRSKLIIMCHSENPNASAPVCGGTEKRWTDGYLIFADDGNYANDIYDSGTDLLLRRGQTATSEVILQTNTAWSQNLKFNHTGNTDEGGSVAIMSVCDNRGVKYGKQIKVIPSGFPASSPLSSVSCTL